MSLVYSGKTDIGMKRSTNQDAIALYPEKHAFLLADGMGGHSGGDIASQMCRDSFSELIDNFSENDELVLEKTILCLNDKIYDHAQKNPELKGMGTTITSLYFTPKELHISNVGDSRVYLFKNDMLFQLTKDHSLVQEKLNLGIHNRQRANQDPQKNVLVRTVGFEPNIQVDNFTFKSSKDDLYLMCSDGLHGKVSDHDLHHIITKHIKNKEVDFEVLDKLNQELIDQANQNGGQDNISVILIYCK